jgi:hypothetical protein
LSHQRGKNKKQKQENKQTKNIPSSNAIQFQLVLQQPVLVLSLSHQSKREREKKRVWRQLCDCLSEAATHQPPTVSHLLLHALFIADLRNGLYTHLVPQALFI